MQAIRERSILCPDPELQRQVAIKLLDRSLNRSGDNVRDFLREARAISWNPASQYRLYL
ncbi:hypothetical protein [Candidatus Vondammii sp. HM_W22]|uniref:hypothetical protein n=1 Tax=Candidatus Vondammii sp. HM_W22 TaxID=2687299 RepID=UPI001F13846C|nr:hypothetical protein [Candidatus Vondammii sp. HM_W22]